MRKILPAILAIFVISCSEPYDLQTGKSEKTYLCVEAALSTLSGTQTVRLSESVDYQSDDQVPPVTGAKVEVSDGEQTYLFAERPGTPGSYDSPAGFLPSRGKTYTLNVECTVDGSPRSCSARSTMEEDGFDIEKIDCKNLGPGVDSTWVIGVWGQDRPQTSYFLITTAVNGVVSPATAMLERAMLMPDTYFNGSYVTGFPIGYLYQNARQQQKYGACAKTLEKGDVVSLVVYSMTKDYYDFVLALSSASSAVSIPVISSQPANLPTNLEGEDVMGYFAACPVCISSCVIDDPERTEWRSSVQ